MIATGAHLIVTTDAVVMKNRLVGLVTLAFGLLEIEVELALLLKVTSGAIFSHQGFRVSVVQKYHRWHLVGGLGTGNRDGYMVNAHLIGSLVATAGRRPQQQHRKGSEAQPFDPPLSRSDLFHHIFLGYLFREEVRLKPGA